MALPPPGKETETRFLLLVRKEGAGIYSVAPIPTPIKREKNTLNIIEQRKYQKKKLSGPKPGRKTSGAEPKIPSSTCQIIKKGMKKIRDTFMDCQNIFDWSCKILGSCFFN